MKGRIPTYREFALNAHTAQKAAVRLVQRHGSKAAALAALNTALPRLHEPAHRRPLEWDDVQGEHAYFHHVLWHTVASMLAWDIRGQS